MALLIEDLKPNRLYKKNIYLPSNTSNKRKNSVIFLMTPNYASSLKCMTLPYFLNNGRYESYYTEKDISFVIRENNTITQTPYEDVVFRESSLSSYDRVVCDTIEELDRYGIPHDDNLDDFIAYAFIDNGKPYGYIILTGGNTKSVYDINSNSVQMKDDMLKHVMSMYDITSVKISDGNDKRICSRYGFKSTPGNKMIMVRPLSYFMNESAIPSKIDLEIKIWEAQIKLTELILKNFDNENWMSHMFKSTKRKLLKIPLPGFIHSIDDTIEIYKSRLSDQKATLAFYTSVKEIELKEELDISDIINEYVDWVDKLSCPKALKLKIINEVISAYERTIKEYEFNLKRYRALDDGKKRLENGMALVSKVTSIFSFVSTGPLSILKSMVLKSILPKTRKKNVLSESELEAKIELYSKIVEALKEKRDDISALKESAIIKEDVISYTYRSLDEENPLTDSYLYNGNSITFLENAYNESPMDLRKMLYTERIKNSKEVFLLYDQVKSDCPFIKYTYITYERYLNKNLFIDWSYYTAVFFKNNIRRLDKAVDLFIEFTSKFIDDTRIDALGYNRKSIIIPVDDWLESPDMEQWDYRKHLNPISIIHRLVYRDLTKLQTMWGNTIVIFTGRNGYFTIDFSKFEKKNLAVFLQNIRVLLNNSAILDDTSEPDNSIGGIVNQVIDRIEGSQSNIKIDNLVGATSATPEEIANKIKNAPISSDNPNAETEEKLVDAITKVASTSIDADDTMAKIDSDEYIKELIVTLKNTSPNEVSLNPTRTARMVRMQDSFTKQKIENRTVAELLANNNDSKLEETALPVDSINEEWKHMTFMNHDKTYDLNSDIVNCIYHFASVSEPFGVRKIDVVNTSTSEDWVETWTVNCEDSRGKRFTLKFDIPVLKNSRFMHLRGNDKTINGQRMNLPIIKTAANTCQMTSNYNKIFFSGYGTSSGKSYVVADRILKTLAKLPEDSDIKVEYGDNSRISSKYELPSDYIDIGTTISKIRYRDRYTKDMSTIFFNQDEIFEKHKDLITDKDSIPLGIRESKGERSIIYMDLSAPTSLQILNLIYSDKTFAEIYDKSSVSIRYTYSKASILNTEIPVAVLVGYYVGLIGMLDRAKIEYTVSTTRPTYNKSIEDVIRLSDAYIVYHLDYDSSMLLNGLKECDTVAYSIKEVNSKKMWIEFLDAFGGRLKADGLDMFNDLMIDPITKVVCNKYELPINFVDALLYSNMLLSDNKYTKHGNITGTRYRSTEIIAGYTYKALCNSYTQYRRDLRSGRDAKLTMKQSAVLDLLFLDNTFSDLSALSDLLELETANTTSSKGLSGMNTERAYGLDKRTFDDSMINSLSLSTGFSGNAGVSRQATIDMNIDSARGYIKNSDINDMSITKTFCMTEALVPFGTTSDDTFRSAMTFIQTAKHSMRTRVADPLLVTNGSDVALPYLTSDTFTYKAKKSGKVKIKTDDYMILEYKDKTTEVVDLRETVLKNSDGGMYIAVKLNTDLKEGSLFSDMEIVAQDDLAYSSNVGPSGELSYNVGTLVKFAILTSDEGFEDSCISSDWLASALSSTVVLDKDYTVPKDTNIHYIIKKGQHVEEGDPLLIFQNSFDEEDANMLIKSLSEEDGEDIIAELGRIPITSKVTGTIKDIKILRTVDKEELSPSLLKIVNAYEKDIKDYNKVLNQYDKDKVLTADATYKLEPTGKLKNARDSVRFEFRIAYEDNFGIGDKVVLYSALKGVAKGIIPKGDEPYSEFRPQEKIHYIQTATGDMKRMVGSILKVGAINKVMIELTRASRDIMGIPWKYLDEY